MAGVVLALPEKIDAWPDIAELLFKAGIGASVYASVAFTINAANCRKIVTDFLSKIKDRMKATTPEAMP